MTNYKLETRIDPAFDPNLIQPVVLAQGKPSAANQNTFDANEAVVQVERMAAVDALALCMESSAIGG